MGMNSGGGGLTNPSLYMLRATYDPNANGKVEASETADNATNAENATNAQTADSAATADKVNGRQFVVGPDEPEAPTDYDVWVKED